MMTPGMLPWQRLWLLLLLLGCLFVPARSTICAGLTYYSANTSSQTFTSPDYPSSYGINVYCSWLIEAADSSHNVRIIVDTSSLEDPDGGGDCSFDYGKVYDANSMATLLGSWCGTTTPTLTSTGSQMLVVFRSDHSTVATGFSLSYLSGTFPTVSSTTDYTIAIACPVTAFVIVVGIIVFFCIRCRHKKRQKQSISEDKETLPESQDVEANYRRYPQSAKSRFSQRIIPSSKGKRPRTELAVEPENSATSRTEKAQNVVSSAAAAAATAKTTTTKEEEEEKEKKAKEEEKEKEAERKKAEEKAAKEAQKARVAEEKRRIVEEKKTVAEKAAKEKKIAAEEKKIAAAKTAEERKNAAEERKNAAAKVAEEKKIAAEKAAEEKKITAEEKRIAAEEKQATTALAPAEKNEKASENAATTEQEKHASEDKQKRGEDTTTAEDTPQADVQTNDVEKPSTQTIPGKEQTTSANTAAAAANAAATAATAAATAANAAAAAAEGKGLRPGKKQTAKKIVGFEEKTQEFEVSDSEESPQADVPAALAAAAAASNDAVVHVQSVAASDVTEVTPGQDSSDKTPSDEGKPKESKEKSKSKSKKPKGNAKTEKANKVDAKPTRPLTREKSSVSKPEVKREKSTGALLQLKEKSTVDKSAVKNSSKASDATPKEKPKPKSSEKPKTPQNSEKPKTPQNSEKPKTNTTQAKTNPKEGKSDRKEVSKPIPTTVVTVKPATTPKEKTKPEKQQKTQGRESTAQTSAQPEPDPQTGTNNDADKSGPVLLTNQSSKEPAGISFGNKPGEVTRPGSKAVLLPTVVMVESAESKKRKKLEDQWDKLSLARQDQASVHGGDVTPRVSTATSSVQRKYQPINNARIREEEGEEKEGVKVKVAQDDPPEGERAHTSGSVASLEKDEGINMDYEGGESGKSTPASHPTRGPTPRINTPRDNNVVTPSVVHANIVSSSISSTPDPQQQPVPIEAPFGERSGSSGCSRTPTASHGDPTKGSLENVEKRLKVVMQWPRPWTYRSLQFCSLENVEKRLKVVMQWPRPWTYRSLQFSEKDVTSDLSMQRAKTTLNSSDQADVQGAPTTVPRLVKEAFGAEDEENNSTFKNAVITTLAKKREPLSKITPKGRNLITR